MTGPDTRGEELIGKTLGSYFVEHRLGAGATGVVFRVRGADQRTLALKVLHENLGSIGSLKRRFEREARVLAKLEHPNVVRITDFGVVAGATYIAMELLEGQTLEELLDTAPLEPERGIRILAEVLKGLAFAHQRSVVHRDLKPANVFLCKDPAGGEDLVKLLDFGLAKILSDDDSTEEGGTLTRRGRIVGTPAYMAPEQITGVSLDVRADVYSAGILLYELLCDRRPFLFDRRSELLRAHLLEPVPPLVVARPELRAHPELAGIVQRALEKNPVDRFPDAKAMLDALLALPPNPVRLEAPTSSPERARAGATSEVITSGERRAVSTSVSTGDPAIPSAAPRSAAAPRDVLTSAIPGAPARAASASAPANTSPKARNASVSAGVATPPRAAPVVKEPVVSTTMLYVLATSLFGIAGLLWWALGPG